MTPGPSPPPKEAETAPEAAPWFSVRWGGDAVLILDQRELPSRECVLRLADVEAVACAIEDLSVRGAPAIGIAAAMGVALASLHTRAVDAAELALKLAPAIERLLRTRPTAVNLAWALARMGRVAASAETSADALRERLIAEAQAILDEDIACCRAIGRSGLEIVAAGARILTYCNTGGLATGGWGTALGVVRTAHAAGRAISVLACETRPVWQGARLTAWECARDGIPVELITDNQAAYWMARGEVDLVVVGADRIAANGDVANKIGTYGLAVLAAAHDLPFYVAAPRSTIDPSTPSGDGIPIEQRPASEVTEVGGQRVAAAGVVARNPAFDVTPARLVTGVISEVGIARSPYAQSLAALIG